MSEVVEKVVIKGDVSDVLSKLDQMEKALVGAHQKGQKAAKDASDGQVASFIKGQIAALSFANAVGVARDILADSVKMALAQEKALILQRAAIETMLPGMGKYSVLLREQAEVLKAKVGIDDDEIRTLQNMALTYGKSISQVEAYTKASIILSNATGGRVGLTEAMLSLIRTEEAGAVNRSLKGIPALEKLTKAQLENGDAITVVNEKMQGLLTLQNEGAIGRINEFSNAWDDVKKNLGGVIVNSDFLLGSLRGLSSILNELASSGPLAALSKIGDNKAVMGALAINPLTAGIAGGIGAIKAYDYAKKTFRSVGEMEPGAGGVTGERSLQEQLAIDEANKPAQIPSLPTEEAFGKLRYSKEYLAQKDDRKKALAMFSDRNRGAEGGKEILASSRYSAEAYGEEIEKEQAAEDLRAANMAANLDLKASLQQRYEEGLTSTAESNAKRREEISEKETAALAENLKYVSSIAEMTAQSAIGALEDWATGNEVSGKKILLDTLKMIGHQLVAEGTKAELIGATRALMTWGADPTAYGLMAQGGVLIATGLAMGAGAAKFTGGFASKEEKQQKAWSEQEKERQATAENYAAWQSSSGGGSQTEQSYRSSTSTARPTSEPSRTVTITVQGNLSLAETGVHINKALSEAAKQGLITG